MNKKEFREKLISEKNKRGWNMKVLSERLGIPYKTVQQWILGLAAPSAPWVSDLIIDKLVSLP